MARPRLPDADRRNETVEVRVSSTELAAIRRRAQEAGISVSEYVRTRILADEQLEPIGDGWFIG